MNRKYSTRDEALEAGRIKRRDWMRRFRQEGRVKQVSRWTEKALTEPWAEYRARRMKERGALEGSKCSS